MRKRTSIVWQIPKEEFAKIITNSKTVADILRHFGLPTKGSSYKTIKKRIQEDNIDDSHIPKGRGSNRGIELGFRPKRPLSEILCKNSTFNSYHLKNRLVREGILKKQCNKCGIESSWQNEPLSLTIDHINGDSHDNRLSNLRLLCPNCHSQTPTFGSKSWNKKRYNCKQCGKNITKYSKTSLCRSCASRTFNRRKVDIRPPKNVLLKEIAEMGYCNTGRKYGVSDNAIRKWLK